jgi:hypothetical protein
MRPKPWLLPVVVVVATPGITREVVVVPVVK